MIVNLSAYLAETASMVRGASEYVEPASVNALNRIVSDLEMGLESGQDHFPWSTRGIRTKAAERYDSRNGTSTKVAVQLSFAAQLSRIGNQRSLDWRFQSLVTHIKVFRADGGDVDPIAHFHVDKKNKDQRGPDVHLQLSESCTERLGMRLAVPRFPFGFVLPTDCLDFVLSEFFPDDWGQTQTGMYRIQDLRKAQMKRAADFAADLQRAWEKGRTQTPVKILQDFVFSDQIRLC